MAAYIIAEVEITNPTGYELYRPLAGASITQYGGKFVVRGGEAKRLEGAGPAPRLVVIEFPDAEAARTWYNSPEYQSALPLRLANSKGQVFIVEGA
jgi:uncharacterized protein (DUF1330 family)